MTVARFRKKPVVVEAVQIRVDNDEALLAFLREYSVPFEMVGDHELVIHTREGDMLASPRDWIIRGVAGEFYPCKPDIFAATYEPADDV